MSADRSDHLPRFDIVFRTLLVVASILISGAYAFYKELVPSSTFPALVFMFVLSICTWALATLWGGVEEVGLKLIAWWSLMVAFTAVSSRLIFYSSYNVPRFVLTIGVFLSFLLSYPMFGYFRNLISSRDSRNVKLTIIIVTVFLVVFDVAFAG